MTLGLLLKLQLLYAAAGILFNLLSIIYTGAGGQPLMPTNPYVGVVAMVVYSAMTIPGHLGYERWYRGLMLVAVVLLGYSGIVRHLMLIQETPAIYPYLTVAALGISINVSGLMLNAVGLLKSGLFLPPGPGNGSHSVK